MRALAVFALALTSCLMAPADEIEAPALATEARSPVARIAAPTCATLDPCRVAYVPRGACVVRSRESLRWEATMGIEKLRAVVDSVPPRSGNSSVCLADGLCVSDLRAALEQIANDAQEIACFTGAACSERIEAAALLRAKEAEWAHRYEEQVRAIAAARDIIGGK